MAEARLLLGQKMVMELDPVTGGWFLVTQGDAAESVSVTGSVSISNIPLPVTGMIGVSGSVAISTSPVPTSENWRVALTADETADDSDKTFTVPANQEWQILSVWVEYTSVTGSARQLEIQLQDDASDVIGAWQAGLTQAASLTYNYLFAPAMPDMTAVRDTNYLTTPLPPTIFLSAGEKLRVWDNNVVNADHDDMIVQIKYAWRTV